MFEKLSFYIESINIDHMVVVEHLSEYICHNS